jgi:hypothetical protein
MIHVLAPADDEPVPEPVFGGRTATPSLPALGTVLVGAGADVFVAAAVAGGSVGAAVEVGDGV